MFLLRRSRPRTSADGRDGRRTTAGGPAGKGGRGDEGSTTLVSPWP